MGFSSMSLTILCCTCNNSLGVRVVSRSSISTRGILLRGLLTFGLWWFLSSLLEVSPDDRFSLFPFNSLSLCVMLESESRCGGFVYIILSPPMLFEFGSTVGADSSMFNRWMFSWIKFSPDVPVVRVYSLLVKGAVLNIARRRTGSFAKYLRLYLSHLRRGLSLDCAFTCDELV